MHKVELDKFEGPLDLLLYFIRRDELDINDIPIAKITAEYLQIVEDMKAMNLSVAGEFILMAATLMRIKSKMLLPRSDLDDLGEPIDPRTELVQQLIEYKKYKDIADNLSELMLPYFQDMVHAGFPSPASDFIESPIDLNEYLIKNNAATFLVRVSGKSMVGAGINDGATLIIDRSIKPSHNSIIVAAVDGEFVCRRLKTKPKLCLVAENKGYKPIYINSQINFEVTGLVTSVINQFT